MLWPWDQPTLAGDAAPGVWAEQPDHLPHLLLRHLVPEAGEELPQLPHTQPAVMVTVDHPDMGKVSAVRKQEDLLRLFAKLNT